MKKFFTFLEILAILVSFSLLTSRGLAQSESNRLAFGFHAGGAKYWGEFTDNQFFFGGDVYLRYNIFPFLSIHADAGLAQLRYKVTDDLMRKYPDFFGTTANGGGAVGGLYPGTATRIEEKNAIRTVMYQGLLSLNIFTDQRIVPYLIGGVAYVDWNNANLYTNAGLPSNRPEGPEHRKFMFPLGLGFEFYLTDNLTINGRGLYYNAGTDYFDNYSTGDNKADEFITFGLGASYYIFGDLDNDKDGLTNAEEEKIGTDPNNPDTDGEGLNDYEEVRTHATNPLKADTDTDNLTDFAELRTHNTSPVRADTDSDRLNDGEEIARRTDPNKVDTDGDELIDGDEVTLHKTDPTKGDTDSDALNDGNEIRQYKTDPLAIDTDRDGLNDGQEINSTKTDPAKADTDADGLNDGDEVNKYLTEASNPDTDNDKIMDGEEILRYKTNPVIADTDKDGLIDGDEISARYGTDPLNPDTDRDTILDGQDDCPLIAGVRQTETGKNGCPAPPKIGTRVDFPEILFIVDTDQFNYTVPETAQNLAKLLAYVNQCENLQVRIEGHASAEGKATRNQELSEMRAAKVKSWLVENGVSPDKIPQTLGFGSTKPKAPEPTGKALKKMKAADLEAIRKLNRRITVEVVRSCD